MFGGLYKDEALPTKQLGAGIPAFSYCSRAPCQDSGLPGWSLLEEDNATVPSVPPLAYIATSIKFMARADLLWLQGWLEKALQVQDGCTSVHRHLVV